jgi:uncharacterized YccA/Bax inhibitor family protein
MIVGVHLLRDFGTYGIIFKNMCVVITVAMIMLLRDFGPYWMIFMSICVYYYKFFRHP